MLLIGYFKICYILNIFCKYDVSSYVIIYCFQNGTVQRRQSVCSSVRHQTLSRCHCGLQIIQTSTQSVIKYGLFFNVQTVDEL